MAVIRRNKWQIVLIVLILCTVITPFIWMGNSPQPAQAQDARASSEDAGTELYLYQDVQLLRRELALTNQDLAAMGATKAAASNVLENLKSWVKMNKQQLDEVRTAQRDARRTLRQLMQKVNVGPKDESVMMQLPNAVAAVEAANGRYRQLIDSIVPTVSPQLVSADTHIWQAARANQGKSSDLLRYAPGVSEEQLKQLKTAVSQAGRSANRDRGTNPLETVLNHSQLQAVRNASIQMQVNMPMVLEAEKEVLPLPKELKEEYSGEFPVPGSDDERAE